MRSSTHSKKNKILLSTLFYFALSIVVVYLLLFAYAKHIDNPYLAPYPNVILKSLGDILTMLSSYIIIFSTILRIILCLIIAMIFGSILGLLAFKFKNFEHFIKPYITFFRTIPVIVVILVAVFISSFSVAPYIVCIFMIIPIIYEGVKNGLKDLDESLMDVWKLDSKLNFQVIKKAILPLIRNHIKTSFISAMGLGFKVLIMSEYISGTKNSIGNAIVLNYQNTNYAALLAWAIITVFIVYLIEALTKILKFNK